MNMPVHRQTSVGLTASRLLVEPLVETNRRPGRRSCRQQSRGVLAHEVRVTGIKSARNHDRISILRPGRYLTGVRVRIHFLVSKRATEMMRNVVDTQASETEDVRRRPTDCLRRTSDNAHVQLTRRLPSNKLLVDPSAHGL